MKKTFLGLLIAGIWLTPSLVRGQSTVEYEVGSSIEVQAGADVSADNIITNSNYSGGGTFNSGPLPVTMAAMSVQAAKNTATILWRTETELENHGFGIERRVVQGSMLNVRGNTSLNLEPGTWNQIAFVPGAGTSSSPRDYSFVDQQVSPGRYAYRIKQIDHSGASTYTSTLEVEIGLAPLVFALAQNYPNPFNPTTTIEFTLPEDGRVKLRIYNMLGEEVVMLVDEDRKAGVYQQVLFDASRLSTGLYISRLEFKEKQLVKKMLMVK